MAFEIREATPEDLQHILTVYLEAGLADRGTLSLQEAINVYQRMKQYPSFKLYVAETQGQIVGTFELLIMDNLVKIGLPSGIIEDVSVLPSFQGKGIGKKMMLFALNLCRDVGCYKMALSSNNKRTEAHRFYKSMGFTRHGFSYKIEM